LISVLWHPACRHHGGAPGRGPPRESGKSACRPTAAVPGASAMPSRCVGLLQPRRLTLPLQFPFGTNFPADANHFKSHAGDTREMADAQNKWCRTPPPGWRAIIMPNLRPPVTTTGPRWLQGAHSGHSCRQVRSLSR
jgi:hypothetical protein